MPPIILPEEVRELYEVHQRLASAWEGTPLRFTLDGRLVGDIAEAAAAKAFDLEFPPKRIPGVDLLTKCGKTVQVKASGRGAGPAFSVGKGTADYLIFMQINFSKHEASVIYNGPEAPVRAELRGPASGVKIIALNRLIELNLQQTDRLPRAGTGKI